MKKNKLIYALSGLLVMSFASCELTEQPDSFYEKDTYFDSETKAQMSIYGIHDCIGTQDHYGQFEMGMVVSDDMYYIQGTSTDNTRRDLAHYLVRTTNTWVEKVWMYKYKGIDRASFSIAGITEMPGYEENKKLQLMVAEAHFLRAFLAFDLVKYWGDVPYKSTYSSGYDQAFLPRTDRELIYDEIISDLNFAKENLAKGGDITNPEIPCQGAAHVLLMRVHLYRAGYSLKQNGELTRPDDATRQKHFEAVLSEWNALQSKGYHGFYDGGFEQLFKDYSAGVLNNKESLWEIAFSSPAGEKDNASSYGIYLGPLVDAPNVKPTEKDRFMGRANAFFRVVPAWLDFYEENDTRRDVNICTYDYKWKANVYNHVKEDRTSKPFNWYPGKWRREWMPIGYIDLNNGDVNLCPIRYADAVLMAAEAYNETGNTSQAWTLLNSVRQRAGATPITAENYATLLKAPKVYDLPFISDGDEAGKFRTALYWERGFEMAYEGVRKLDLIRWGVLDKALTLFGEKVTDKDVIKHYIGYKNFNKGQHELLPIPLAEIQSNPMLEGKNNPKY